MKKQGSLKYNNSNSSPNQDPTYKWLVTGFAFIAAALFIYFGAITAFYGKEIEVDGTTKVKLSKLLFVFLKNLEGNLLVLPVLLSIGIFALAKGVKKWMVHQK